MTSKRGEPILKKWRFMTSSHRLSHSLKQLRCQHPPGYVHDSIEGEETKLTEAYPPRLCRTMLGSLFRFDEHSPLLPCIPKCSHQHREKEAFYDDFHVSAFTALELAPYSTLPPSLRPSSTRAGVALGSAPSGVAPGLPAGYDLALALVAVGEATMATNTTTQSTADCPECNGPQLQEVKHTIAAVHKLLNRKEWKGNPEAIKAVKAEADALLKEDTWLEGTVTEFSELVAWAKKAGKRIHIGDLMPICSIKHWETPALRKYKGRVVFRGDAVKDQDGAVAVFQ